MYTHRSPLQAGKSYPLGATWTGQGVNFALFSEHAERVDVCLFDSAGRREVARLTLPCVTDHVWHGFIPDVMPGQLYGYRVFGPYDPRAGHRFNHHKLLVDPYAQGLHGAMQWHPACYGYKIGHPREDLSFDTRDSARYVPKGVVRKSDYPWRHEHRPDTPLDRSILYEAHVKGLTQQHPGVPESLRGTFGGISSPAVIAHLQTLGVTAIELMPVMAFADEPHLATKGLVNYWGYNPLTFFAPDYRYLGGGTPDGFKSMVEKLHAANLEVILDVVYNHTCEGNQLGPTVSLRGIDNKSYYHLVAGNPRDYENHSGCGNTLNLAHPRVLQMTMDSLRYWVEIMHVDGFRFDLAAAMGRTAQGFAVEAPFFTAVRQDPVLNRVKLIAEPWDIGPGGYRLGGFPGGWSEWNDAYRNSVRAFWRGDHGSVGAFATRLAGSSDVFWQRGPLASLNYITAHDGFTLSDLVSYNDKHNLANLEDNQDGTDHNLSWNCGVEGQTHSPEIIALRDRQRRNLMATLLLSQGVPMLLAGDELGRTQQGNNNAYCLDTPLSWLDWSAVEPHFLAFVQAVIALRQAHPALRRRHFFKGVADEPGHLSDLTWLSPSGHGMTASDWGDSTTLCFGALLSGDTGGKTGGHDVAFLILFNASPLDRAFHVPPSPTGQGWLMRLDTASGESHVATPLVYGDGDFVSLVPHSMAILSQSEGSAYA